MEYTPAVITDGLELSDFSSLKARMPVLNDLERSFHPVQIDDQDNPETLKSYTAIIMLGVIIRPSYGLPKPNKGHLSYDSIIPADVFSRTNSSSRPNLDD